MASSIHNGTIFTLLWLAPPLQQPRARTVLLFCLSQGLLRPWSPATVLSTALALATLLVGGLHMGIGPWDSTYRLPVTLQTPSKIYLVPLGRFDNELLQRMSAVIHEHGAPIAETLPGIPYERRAVVYLREQLIGERLIEVMRRRYPRLARDPQVVLLGFTASDMYRCDTLKQRNNRDIRTCGIALQHAFEIREGGRMAVLSTYRLDPRTYGEPSEPELLERRLLKLVRRKIALLYDRLPPNEDPGSILAPSIATLKGSGRDPQGNAGDPSIRSTNKVIAAERRVATLQPSNIWPAISSSLADPPDPRR